MGKKKTRNKEKTWTYGEIHDKARELGLDYDSIEWDSRDDAPRLVDRHGKTVARVVKNGEIEPVARTDVFGRGWTWNGTSWEGEDIKGHAESLTISGGTFTTGTATGGRLGGIGVEMEESPAEMTDGRSPGYDDPAVLRTIIRALVLDGTVDDDSGEAPTVTLLGSDLQTVKLVDVLDQIMEY